MFINNVEYQPQLLPSTEVAFFGTYKHTSPTEGTYYGKTSRLLEFTYEEFNDRRWHDGDGYSNQTVFNRALQKYPDWDSWKHEICKTHLFAWECTFVELCGVLESLSTGHSYNSQIPIVGQQYSGLHTDDSRKRCGQPGEKHWSFGKPRSEESKCKQRVTMSGRPSKLRGRHVKDSTKQLMHDIVENKKKLGISLVTNPKGNGDIINSPEARAKAKKSNTVFYLLSNGLHGTPKFLAGTLHCSTSYFYAGFEHELSIYGVSVLAKKKGSDFTKDDISTYSNLISTVDLDFTLVRPRTTFYLLSNGVHGSFDKLLTELSCSRYFLECLLDGTPCKRFPDNLIYLVESRLHYDFSNKEVSELCTIY